jgi:GT2 family glycosyltransferase
MADWLAIDGMAQEPEVSPKFDSALRTAFHRSGDAVFSGFVVDTNDLTRKFTVELLVDGGPIQVQRADAYVDELAEQPGDGCYGFSFSLPGNTVRNGCVIEARVANIGTPIGSAIHEGDVSPQRDPDGVGTFRWLGGLRFSGWLADGGEKANSADVLVDGELILRVRMSGWTQTGGTPEQCRAVRSFDFHLPERLADGRVHRVGMVVASGETLAGGPVAMVAFAGGLESALSKVAASDSERLQGELFDRINPMSLPFSRYAEWRDGLPAPASPAHAVQCAVAMIGPGSIEDTLQSLQEQSHSDWVAASLPTAGNSSVFEAEHVRAFLDSDGRDCAVVVFGMAGTLLAPTALQRMASALAQFESVQTVYGDVDLVRADGTVWPLAFPAFDYERMLEQGYCAHLFAMRRSTAQRALNAGASSLYRLFNWQFDGGVPDDTVHLPGSLGILPALDVAAASAALTAASAAHLRARGVAAEVVAGSSAVLPAAHVIRRTRGGDTTVVIPTRNRHALLKKCIASIEPAIRDVGARIIIIDNDSTESDALAYLKELEAIAQVVRVEGPFNYARLNNVAAEVAESEYLCLLNNDVEASDDTWLGEMLSRAAPSDVGAVGAMLLYPTGIVQHGGVVLGPNFAAAHAFNDRVADDPGYGEMLRVAHECSAVTAACLVTRRADYRAVGGLDEIRFPINFNDVDYCLKLRAAGKRIVWTPHARLVHAESASRGFDVKRERTRQFERELASLRIRWGETLVDDPFYSPVLSLDPVPFSALAWPPRNMKARVQRVPKAVDVAPGF